MWISFYNSSSRQAYWSHLLHLLGHQFFGNCHLLSLNSCLPGDEAYSAKVDPLMVNAHNQGSVSCGIMLGHKKFWILDFCLRMLNLYLGTTERRSPMPMSNMPIF